ncbi:enoyl-CoA hydratase [bacterium K02(2017)]|nr:enoyl-CoA hydratase [bacterium K02(2017)]
MSSDFLICEINNGVALVTLNRPEIHNAFNDVLMQQIKTQFEALDNDDRVRVVVLTGAGKSFSAGADLNWMKSMVNLSAAESYQDSLKLAGLFQGLNDFTKPIIGKVNGPALGGGGGLVAICDYVIASTKALFGFTEVRLGLVPGVISPYVIAKIGVSQARAWFLSGQRFNADQALKMGLVHQVVAPEELDASSSDVVKSFLSAGPKAAQGAKQLIRDVCKINDRQKLLEHTCKTITDFRKSEEGQEGMAALLNKSKPSWL